MKYLAIFIGGGFGAIMRDTVSRFVYSFFFPTFPYGTMAVNILGSFLFGFLWQLSERMIVSREVKTLVFTGFLGAFTTFSTFSFETANLLREGEIKFAVLNIVLSVFLGLVCIFLGIFLAKQIIRG